MKRCSLDWYATASRVVFAFVLVLSLTCGLGCSTQPRGPGAIEIAHAESAFLPLSADQAAPAPQSVELPHIWKLHERARYRGAHYRVHFALETIPSDAWSVYLARADMNAEVFINGSSVGAVGELAPPISRMRHYPMLRSIPPALLREGENQIDIVLAVEATSVGAISRIEVGPTSVLAAQQHWRTFAQVSWIQISAFAGCVLVLVVATVYGRRGRGSSYRWFQLSVALWIVYASEIWIVEPPLSPQHWEALANGAQYLSIWSIMLGFHRALEGPRHRIEGATLLAISIAITALAVIPAHWVWTARALLGVGICALAGYMVKFVRSAPAAQDWVLEKYHLVGGIFGVAAGFHDIASGFSGWPASGFWLVQHTGGLAIFLTLAAILRHFVSTIRDSRALGRDLEKRIEAHERDLVQQYERMRTLERDRLVARERQRLTRGLHEGVGSVLMSTIAGLETSPNSETTGPFRNTADRIRDALDDLRLVIDSLRPESSLLDILARLRSRLAARFERRGIRVVWRVDDIPALAGFSAEHALALLRILQDALRGPERLRDTRIIVVRTGCEQRADTPGIYVEIEDDGRGTAPRPEHRAMSERASALGGQLSVDRRRGRTHVQLWLPIQLTAVRVS